MPSPGDLSSMKLFDVRILKVGEIFRDDVMSTGMYLSLPDTKPELQVGSQVSGGISQTNKINAFFL